MSSYWKVRELKGKIAEMENKAKRDSETIENLRRTNRDLLRDNERLTKAYWNAIEGGNDND